MASYEAAQISGKHGINIYAITTQRKAMNLVAPRLDLALLAKQPVVLPNGGNTVAGSQRIFFVKKYTKAHFFYIRFVILL